MFIEGGNEKICKGWYYISSPTTLREESVGVGAREEIINGTVFTTYFEVSMFQTQHFLYLLAIVPLQKNICIGNW